MQYKLASVVTVILLSACASLEGQDSSNVAAYCTAENGYRLGSQSKAYFGVCPKETESAFLAGLQRGRALRPTTPAAWPFQEKMDRLEKQLVSTNSEAERNQLKTSLQDAEWWALHIINCSCTYSNGP
jgi:Protein of unknown function (DUF2799)